MKVLIFGPADLDCAASNCGRALRLMGHDVVHFDPDEHPRALSGLRRTWEARRLFNRVVGWSGVLPRSYEPALRRTADQFGPDLLLVLGINEVAPETIARLRKATGTRVAGWYQDHMVNFGSHRFLLAEYDGLFFKDRYIVDRLRDWGGIDNVYYLPEACEPSRHHGMTLTEDDQLRYGCDLMTYGNMYPYRARLLEGVAGRVRMYGERPAPWMTHGLRGAWAGFAVHDDEKIKAVLSAKIIVNTSHFGEVQSVNARTFEVAGIGGFQLSDAPGVAEYFLPGEEIAVFRGPQMLREQIEHYLAHPEERSRIAERGRLRAHRDHTYAARFDEMFTVLGLGSQAGASRPFAEASQ